MWVLGLAHRTPKVLVEMLQDIVSRLQVIKTSNDVYVLTYTSFDVGLVLLLDFGA